MEFRRIIKMTEMKPITIRILLIMTAALCLILFLQGCNPFTRSDNEEEDKVSPTLLTVAYQEESLLHLPLYAAIKQDFFAQKNLKVELQKTKNSQEAVEGLCNGPHDLVLSTPEIGFYSYQQGEQEKLVFIGQLASKSGCFLLSRKSENPFTWSEVKGKVVIGTLSGESSQIALENILRKEHLRPFIDVHLVNNLPLSLRSGIFRSGTGQFILSDEPTATILENEELGLVVASLDDHLRVNIPTVFIATKSKFKENSAFYQNFVTALQLGLAWVEEKSPEEIATVAKDFFPEQEEKILLRGICRYKNMGCWPENTLLTEKELQQFQQILLDAQELNTPLPLYELITSVPIDESGED